jgi:protease-4
MREFFKMMFASMAGFILSMILLFVIFFAIMIGMVASFEKEVKVPENTVLTISLKNAVPERSSNNPFEEFNFTSMKSQKQLGLNAILQSIHYAANDARIKGILLDLSSVPSNYATVEAIRNAVDSFKQSGKFVVAYGENLSQKAYYLASAADLVFMNPLGYLEFKGIYMELMFFKNALTKLEVEAQIIRHGKFKSAVEPFMLEKMSDSNREQLSTYTDGIWNHILSGISESRGISVDELNLIADSLFTWDANGALKYKMVDGLIYRDELDDLIGEKTAVEEGKDISYLSLSNYYENIKAKLVSFKKDKIAVIYANGEIVNGNNSSDVIDGVFMSNCIREAREDSSIKAVVLRVNSPGGDALASDMIWREVYLTNEVKPVIVSMGDYAASGGYYISCAARKIYAEPTTLTGSIGVFGVIPNMEKMFNNKLGITFDNVKTNEHSDYISVTHPMSDFDKALVLKQIENIYSTFLQRVSEGRGMSVDAVDSIGQGRIWSGVDAKRIGLVDEMGGMYDAIAFAASEAGIEEYAIVELPKQKDFLDELLSDMSSQSSIQEKIQNELGVFAPLYKAYMHMQSVQGIQARLPYFIYVN